MDLPVGGSVDHAILAELHARALRARGAPLILKSKVKEIWEF